MTITAEMKELLTVNGKDLRAYVPKPGTRAGDPELAQFFAEVKDLRTLEQAKRGTRMETASVDTTTEKAPAATRTIPAQQNNSGWSL